MSALTPCAPATSQQAVVEAALVLLAASACTRFGVFQVGIASAEDPAATIEPQRARAAQPA